MLTCLEPATKKTSSACMDLDRRVPRKFAKNAFCAAAFRTSTSGTCKVKAECHFSRRVGTSETDSILCILEARAHGRAEGVLYHLSIDKCQLRLKRACHNALLDLPA